MRKSFKTTATGFLAAATLLGGSAFAFAPEFIEDLPTVIITDQDGASSDAFDPDGPYNFRFTDAFELLPKLDPRGNTEAELKYLFNEFENITDLDPVIASESVIQINGNSPFATLGDPFPLDPSDFASAPNVVTGGSSFLSFRNRDFEGGPIGVITGHDIDEAPQIRFISLYVKGDTNDDFTLTNNTFQVITARADGENFFWDELSDPFFSPGAFTDPFDTFLEYETFGGWEFISNNQLVIPGGAEPRVFEDFLNAFNPGANASLGHANTGGTANPGAGPLSLTVTGVAGTGGNPRLAAGPVLDLDADTLYRVRASWASPNAATTEKIRMVFGEANTTGVALAQYEDTSNYSGPFLAPPTTFADQDLYLLTKGSTTGAGIFFDIVTFGGSGQEIQIDRVEVASADRANLPAPTVIRNFGNASVPTLASGEGPEAPGGSTPFVTTPGVVGQTLLPNVSANAAAGLNVAWSLSGTAITLNVPQQTFGDTDGFPPVTQTSPATAGYAPPVFAEMGIEEGGSILDANTPGVFPASDDKLYIIDYYVSSPTAPNPRAVPAQGLLGLSSPISMRLDAKVGASKIYEHEFRVGGDGPTAVGTAPRVYSSIFGGDEGNVFLNQLFIAFLGNFVGSNPVETYTIHRIVVNEYDLP